MHSGPQCAVAVVVADVGYSSEPETQWWVLQGGSGGGGGGEVLVTGTCWTREGCQARAASKIPSVVLSAIGEWNSAQGKKRKSNLKLKRRTTAQT
jgi:hypothetical protein